MKVLLKVVKYFKVVIMTNHYFGHPTEVIYQLSGKNLLDS